MKKIIFISLLLVSAFCNGQTVSWSWESGSNLISQNGTYGTKGVSSSLNVPGTKFLSVSWTDNNNNLWLFGGYGPDGSFGNGYLNDLWKYNTTTKEWTWMSGSKFCDQNGIYGTKGIAAAANCPGSRYEAIGWKDSNGDLWLFGGEGFDAFGNTAYLNDLWKYNIFSGQWTWISGNNITNQVGVYGTLGVGSTTNAPGARMNSSAVTDATGNFWMFGGDGYDISNADNLNDLWMYAPSSNQWTWVSGSNIGGQNGIYGTKGVGSTTNIPGGRDNANIWYDKNGGLWVFGGQSYPETGIVLGFMNDIWKYNINSKEWTWIGGPKVYNLFGTYGTLGVPTASTIPGSRNCSVSWTDTKSNLWLFGGNGNGASSWGELGDLWMFDTITSQWTWMAGPTNPNTYGIYGTKGVSSPTNIPGGRHGHSSWTDNNNNFWLMGGSGYPSTGFAGDLNDLWRMPTPFAQQQTSISEKPLFANRLMIYPNPSDETINLKSLTEIKLKLVNELGQELMNIQLNAENNYKTKITGLPSGIYFIIGESEEGFITKKIIVTN